MLDLAIDLPCSDFDLAAVWDLAPKPTKVFGKFGNLRRKTLVNYFALILFWLRPVRGENPAGQAPRGHPCPHVRGRVAGGGRRIDPRRPRNHWSPRKTSCRRPARYPRRYLDRVVDRPRWRHYKPDLRVWATKAPKELRW